ncbi:MAG TPA: hypothetical protein DCS91_04105 [Microcoleaceae bacterium UBA11344]|nr:hypothetical protein [Microcoleaceae cyanobacterium UBA11344]
MLSKRPAPAGFVFGQTGHAGVPTIFGRIWESIGGILDRLKIRTEVDFSHQVTLIYFKKSMATA